MGRQGRYSPEVRERAVRMVFDQEVHQSSQWSAIQSIASKIGCTAETLRKWVRPAERDACLLFIHLTTEAVRTKRRQIHLGPTPNDLARNLGLSIVGGPRGTALRLEHQVRKLISTIWTGNQWNRPRTSLSHADQPRPPHLRSRHWRPASAYRERTGHQR